MENRKGIILAGGAGTRLNPITKVTSKQLLPIYDKPMIYYPLSTLMLSDIRNILVISTPSSIGDYQSLLGDGSNWGINLEYAIQNEPNGLAEAFIIGRNFVGNNPSTLILGDNIFYGNELVNLLSQAGQREEGATLFAYRVNDPQRFGVIEFDQNKNVISLEEKPVRPKSNFAVTGLYFYDNKVCDFARELKPSMRGEIEITDLNKQYVSANQAAVEILGRGHSWFDTGTQDSLFEASLFIRSLQKHQAFTIAAPEEIALRKGWISKEKLEQLLSPLKNSPYGIYLKSLL